MLYNNYMLSKKTDAENYNHTTKSYNKNKKDSRCQRKKLCRRYNYEKRITLYTRTAPYVASKPDIRIIKCVYNMENHVPAVIRDRLKNMPGSS